ncbi:YfiR family protein [Labilibacter sediminis]|nr:YfiR family protein [Labilibacter sediminis]
MSKKLLGLIVVLLVAFNTKGQVQIQRVEASFIANFMRYVKWPEQESLKTFTIGVFGKNQEIFKELNRTVNGKNVGIATIKVIEAESSAELNNCQIVFVPNGKTGRFKKEVFALADAPMMIITEEQGNKPEYSMINFKVKNSKLTFQLNSEIAKEKKISISNKLSQMAST